MEKLIINVNDLIDLCIEKYKDIEADLKGKVIVIPDLHGQDIWKNIIHKNPDADYYIFLGDELDSYFITVEEQLKNFLEINKFQDSLKSRVIRLLANHTAHYIYEDAPTASGYQVAIGLHLEPMRSYLKERYTMSFPYGNYILTHAGLTNTFLQNFCPEILHYGETSNNPDYVKILSKTLNLGLLSKEKRRLLFAVGPLRLGKDDFSGPLWADKNEVEKDLPNNFHQIVGHTRVPNKLKVNGNNIKSSITFIDTLPAKEKPDYNNLEKYYYEFNSRV